MRILYLFKSTVAMGALLYVMSSLPLSGLDGHKAPPGYRLSQWNLDNGLPGSQVRAVTQTPDGFLWIALQRRLVRFDGAAFLDTGKQTGHKVLKDMLFALHADDTVQGGRFLHIGSIHGLALYDTHGGGVKLLPPEGPSPYPIPVSAILASSGAGGDNTPPGSNHAASLWVCTFKSYLYHLGPRGITHYTARQGLECPTVYAALWTSKYGLLVGTAKGLFKHEKQNFSPADIPGFPPACPVSSFHETAGGTLWIATDRGLFRLRDKSGKLFTVEHGLSHNKVTVLHETGDGVLWIGTGSGLNRLKKGDAKNGSFEKFLEPLFITCLYEDKENNLWIGTKDSGLNCLTKGPAATYTSAEGVPPHLQCLYGGPAGNTWIGTALNGVFRLAPGDRDRTGAVIPYIKANRLFEAGPAYSISAITGDGGGLWIGTAGRGLMRVNTTDQSVLRYSTQTHPNLPGDSVRSLYHDREGALWIGTNNGPGLLRDGKLQSPPHDHPLRKYSIHCIHKTADGATWLGTGKGIAVLPNEGWNVSNFYLEKDDILCIHRAPGDITWVGSTGVLKRFYRGSWTTYGEADGLPAGGIFKIIHYRNQLWLASTAGIIQAVPTGENSAGNNASPSFHFRILETFQGGRERSYHDALRLPGGEFLFAGSKFLSVINPNSPSLRSSPPPFPPVIEKMILHQGDEYRSLNRDKLLPDKNKHRLFKDVETAEFHFNAPAFGLSSGLRYHYRLEGYEKEWRTYPHSNLHAPASRPKVTYGNLPAGAYTFRVSAAAGGSAPRTEEASVTFTLRYGFFNRPIFKYLLVLACLLAAAGAFLGTRAMMRRKKKKYSSSTLDTQKAEHTLKKLIYLLETEKIYLEESISLQVLSERLSIHPNHLSRIINERLNKNFFDLINSFRIEEAKRQLQQPGSEKTILQISYDVGFNSKAAFYRSFSRYTGMTPSQYKQTRK